jgi:hypothetical protein
MFRAVLHPYYKLDYIELTWGGAEEQAKERAAGDPDAKNWKDEARKLVEHVVQLFDARVPFNESILSVFPRRWADIIEPDHERQQSPRSSRTKRQTS